MKKSFRFFLHSFYCCADVQERMVKKAEVKNMCFRRQTPFLPK